jgi:hypothetical protein
MPARTPDSAATASSLARRGARTLKTMRVGISDSVTEVTTAYCSDGSHKTEKFLLAHGHASGGYAIARTEFADGDAGNATQAESDAGC